MQMTSDAQEHTGNQHDPEYEAYLGTINSRVKALITSGHHLFRTDADPDAMWEAYLGAFPEGAERQFHNCSCCRHFIHRYGDLVVLREDGTVMTALWVNDTDEGLIYLDAPTKYLPSVKAMLEIVHKSEVSGPLVSSEALLGDCPDRRMEPLPSAPAEGIPVPEEQGDVRRPKGTRHPAPQLTQPASKEPDGSLPCGH